MENKDVKELGKDPVDPNSKENAPKEPLDNAPKPPTQAEIESKQAAEAAAAAAAAEVAASEYIQSVIPAGIARASKEFIKAVSRYDRKSNAVQPAEMWKYKDKDFQAHGRL